MRGENIKMQTISGDIINNNQISISKKGLFLNNEQINLMESDFKKLLCKHGISEQSEGNSVIFYSYNAKETVFIQQMEIWLTKDKYPLSEEDIKKIETLQKSIGFTYDKNLKLNTKVHFTIFQLKQNYFTMPFIGTLDLYT